MTIARPAHASLAAGRWRSLSLLDQLANIGSEVDRALRASEQGRPDRRDHAADRALELFDLTAADPRWRGHRRREILRTREEFCRLLWGESDAGDMASMRRSFLHFATAARRKMIRPAVPRTTGEPHDPSPYRSSPIRVPEGTGRALLDEEREEADR